MPNDQPIDPEKRLTNNDGGDQPSPLVVIGGGPIIPPPLPPNPIGGSVPSGFTASDGSLLNVRLDNNGRIIEAQGVGTDGIPRSFKVYQNIYARGALRFSDTTYAFFENSDKAYFSFSFDTSLRGSIAFILASSIDKSLKATLTMGEAATFGKASISKQLFVQGKWQPEESGFVDLNVASFASLTPSIDLPFGSLFQNEFNRVSYFNPLLKQMNDDTSTEGQASLQALSVNINMSPLTVWQSYDQNVTLLRFSWTKSLAKAGLWALAFILGLALCSESVGAACIVGGAAAAGGASLGGDAIDSINPAPGGGVSVDGGPSGGVPGPVPGDGGTLPPPPPDKRDME